MTIISITVGKNPLEETQQESEMQYLGAVSKMTEWSLFVSKGKPFSVTEIQTMPQPQMLKKLRLNGSMKTYKTF